MVRTGTMKILKESTRRDHELVETYPLTRALASGTIRRPQYAALLAGYGALQRVLERRTRQLTGLAPLADRILERLDAIDADLSALGGVAQGELVASAQLEARVASWTVPMLVGACYVFEGAALGNAFMWPRLREALALSDDESRYFRGRGPETMGHFRAFGDLANEIVDLSSAADAVLGARRAFRAVGDALEEIWVGSSPRRAQLWERPSTFPAEAAAG